jgi:hypothetical protein
MNAVSKYGNKRVQTEDGWFDSQAEHRRWCELKLMERAGKIKNLRRQVDFELIPAIGGFRKIIYRADFVYEEDGREVVEDRKGFRDRVYRLKCRLMLWRHNIVIRET